MRCIWWKGPSSGSMPSHCMLSRITSSAAWLERCWSVASMRRMKSPPMARANAQGESAERMFPRWMKPVGDGAKRVRTRAVPEAVGSVISDEVSGFLRVWQRQARVVLIARWLVHTSFIQACDALGRDVAGDIHAVKAGGVEPGNGAVERTHGLFHAIHILVDERVTADGLANFFDRAAMGHQFAAGGHVDTVDIGVAHRRRGAGQVDLARACVACHLHDLAAGGAAHDGVVDQQHVAALELAGDHVELLAHGLLAHALPEHDEGAAHIA